MHIKDFDYHLPENLIAQHPTDQREQSRLLVVDRSKNLLSHKHFYDVIDYLEPGDCLVLNDSRVIPARLFGWKEKTGAKVEFLLIRRIDHDIWETMVKPGRKLHPGDVVNFSQERSLRAEILSYGEDGTRQVRFEYDGVFLEILEQLGEIPLPPYIERKNEEQDRERYQTVYSKNEGSVAAPTAGLHFTKELLDKVEKKGVKLAYLTLHVGIGTFRPVKCEAVEEHHMHFEEYEIEEIQAERINQTRRNGGRVIAVGTTSARTLESAALENGMIRSGRGNTDIFIYPGYQFHTLDGLITNFHLPKSTLLMLISAFYDREKVLQAYGTAVCEGYRFFSYGDAMLIL